MSNSRHSKRITPSRPLPSERLTSLSLLDATTANFALTSAVWLLDAPSRTLGENFDLGEHLSHCLRLTLDAYPHWCGRLKKIDTLGPIEAEARDLPAHAHRFGRIYAHYGTPRDPGVEFVVANSDAELDKLHDPKRESISPVWESDQEALKQLLPPTVIDSLNEPNEPDESGKRKPLVAFQLAKLADGGFAVGAKVAHPLADITSLVRFMKDWAEISRCVLDGVAPPALSPVFEPWKIDEQAAGNINTEEADLGIVQQAEKLPFERYDWWASSLNKCESPQMPDAFRGQDLRPVGKPMPWSEWDLKVPVACRTIHFTLDQVEYLQTRATTGHSQRISKHDVLLGHVWSCITRARDLEEDQDLVHCNLVYGLRPLFRLGKSFIGSPIVMTNVELSGKEVTNPENAASTALKVRESLSQAANLDGMAAHLHSLAHEKSPQRIWQAFLGRQHILVTTWARAGVYEIDFGLGSRIRYVDGLVPLMDGTVLIKEAPEEKSTTDASQASEEAKTWTDNGVDVTVNLTVEAMERLIGDPLLFPTVH